MRPRTAPHFHVERPHPSPAHATEFYVLLIVCSTIVISQKQYVFKIVLTMPRIPSPSMRAILAENVRSFRKEHGLSQEELADRCELHRTYIGSVEREERNVSLSTLEVLSQALGVSAPELLTPRAEHDAKNTP